LVEHEYDFFSQGRLSALDIADGHTCLEIGPGTGSMAQWMASVTRPSGRVVCIDIDDRFFPLLEGHGIDLIQGDVRVAHFEESTFDFIHARPLVEHLADREEVLAGIVRWLKPGGWMVLVDSDYSFGHRTHGQLGELWSRVQEATADIVTARGSDFRFGMPLPRLMTPRRAVACTSTWRVPVDRRSHHERPLPPGLL
jgi:ubiquinone/menaquinone biosynthesis C-methylase UbiE